MAAIVRHPQVDDDDIDGCLIAAQCAADALNEDDDYNAIGEQSLSLADRNPPTTSSP